MKKPISSIHIESKEKAEKAGIKALLSLFIPGCILLVGFWGGFFQEMGLDIESGWPVIFAFPVLFLSLFLRTDRRRHVLFALVLLFVFLLLGVFFHTYIGNSLAGLLEKINHWYLLRRGVYSLPFKNKASILPIMLIFGLISGIVTALLLKLKTGLLPSILGLLILVMWISGILESGFFVGVFLTGVLPVLAQKSSEGWRGLCLANTIVITILLLLVILPRGDFHPTQGGLGSKLESRIHSLMYEKSRPALPEGNLMNLGTYSPSKEKTLAVSMKDWKAQYIRGYIGEVYTATGWKELPKHTLAKRADRLYALQKKHFFGPTEISAAWQDIGEESKNRIGIENLGASKAHAYIPYGFSDFDRPILEPAHLSSEGVRPSKLKEYEADIFPVEKSYILQSKIAKKGKSDYLSAEATYRDWVYKNYLSIPEETHKVLNKHFDIRSGNITTVRASRDIVKSLEESLTYKEGSLTRNGKSDFASYVLEVGREGYSVHYATLATLLLRTCGIPARYVEGYIVPSARAETKKEGGTVILTQRNSHAWSEYYLDGVGWIPLDPTPGYTDLVEYDLPEYGMSADQAQGAVRPLTQDDLDDKKEPKVEQEKKKKSQKVYLREAKIIVVFLILLLVLIIFLRTYIKRKKLQKRRQSFYGEDYRKASAAVICYIEDLAEILGFEKANRTVAQETEIMSEIFPEIDPAAARSIIYLLWYSRHSITSGQHEQTLSWLETVEEHWNNNLSAWQKFYQKYLVCKVI